MTDEQWTSLNAKITSLQIFVAALCNAQPDQRELRELVNAHREVFNTASLNSPATDARNIAVLSEVDRMISGLWG